jgi:antitoxin (DNA-binding transcriptional repressor) of toxin-antitoxin stability system
MNQMTASALKAKCLQLMDGVAATGEPILITQNDQLICQLVPYRRKPKTLYGALWGSIGITGDLIAPLDVVLEGLQWSPSIPTP